MILRPDGYPKVTVVLVGYNSVNYLATCLPSLIESDYPDFQVVYVDNGSGDKSAEYVERNFRERVVIIPLPRNYGFSIACNFGARHASGKYLIFLNVDTVVKSNWLRPLVSALEGDQTIGAAQSKLLRIDGKTIDSLGGFITPYGTVWSKGHGHPDSSSFQIEEIFYSKGAAMITRKELWEKIGGFDPCYFLYFQETDYCWRLWSSGYRVVCIPSSTVLHVGGGVASRTPQLVKFYEARERLMLLIRNYSARRLARYLPVTVSLHLANVIRHLLKGDLPAAMSILRGTHSALSDFRAIRRSRGHLSNISVNEEGILRRLMLHETAWTFR